jgi:SAM-dependent methyltransferase/3-polyprenyl-4-hydroxybenzoate decarboxylase
MDPIQRARVIRAYDRGGETTLLTERGDVLRFTGDSAALVRAILLETASRVTQDELLARLAALAGEPVAWAGAVADAVAQLEAAGALGTDEVPRLLSRARPGRRVLLGLTGAVAASFAPALVQLLQARGIEVRVAATRRALRFVGALALEALTHAPVVSSLWPRDAGEPVPHIALARWADLVVVYPASAASIARLATGSTSTVVTAAAIASRAPVLVIPSMNDAMYLAPSLQRNLEQLREDGFLVAHPVLGIEVADAPDRRMPMLGAAPPIGAVVDLVEAILEHEVPARSSAAPDWDRLYQVTPLERLPWHTEALDEDLAAALDGLERGAGRLLDLGTGVGTAAIAAADRGFTVVATDVAPHALDVAAARAGARPIVFLRDDILATSLHGSFDVVLDRGLCHVLLREKHAAYAARVAALVRPGGHFVLKCHAAAEPVDRGTSRFTREDVTRLFGAAFELVRIDEAVFPGPSAREEWPKALLCVLRRNLA